MEGGKFDWKASGKETHKGQQGFGRRNAPPDGLRIGLGHQRIEIRDAQVSLKYEEDPCACWLVYDANFSGAGV